MKKILFLSSFFLFFIATQNSLALEMQSPEYKLEIEDLTPSTTPIPALLEEKPPEVQPPSEYEKIGYKMVNSTATSFTVSIDKGTIEFESFDENPSQEKEINLHIMTDSSYGFQIITKPISPLLTSSNNIIADTICAHSAQKCTESLAQPWVDTGVYGIGYRVDGDGKPKDFLDNTYYRVFSKQSYTPLLFSSQGKEIYDSIVKFKIHVDKTQPKGSYIGVNSLIALPVL